MAGVLEDWNVEVTLGNEILSFELNGILYFRGTFLVSILPLAQPPTQGEFPLYPLATQSISLENQAQNLPINDV